MLFRGFKFGIFCLFVCPLKRSPLPQLQDNRNIIVILIITLITITAADARLQLFLFLLLLVLVTLHLSPPPEQPRKQVPATDSISRKRTFRSFSQGHVQSHAPTLWAPPLLAGVPFVLWVVLAAVVTPFGGTISCYVFCPHNGLQKWWVPIQVRPLGSVPLGGPSHTLGLTGRGFRMGPTFCLPRG